MQHPLYYSTCHVFCEMFFITVFCRSFASYSPMLFLQCGAKAAVRSPLHALQLPEQETDLDHIRHLRIGKSLVKGLDQYRSFH